VNAIRTILAIVDPTAEQHPAVEKSAILAQKFDARLDLFVCDTKASREARAAARVRARPGEPSIVGAKPIVEELARPLRERGLDVTTEAACSDPLHAALIARARRTSADLVVKDTHHHSLVKRTFLTNTDWHLIRSCPVPLLLTKPTVWASAPIVVAAVDPGHVNDKPALLDNRIMDYAALVSKRLGGDLHILHAYLPQAIVAAAVASTPPTAMGVSERDFEIEADHRRQLVNALVAEYPVGAERLHVEVGGPAEVLPRVAAQLQADIVIMGAISRSGLKRAFVGSTAEDVLERLPCDAFIVQPPDFAEMLPFDIYGRLSMPPLSLPW